MAPAHEPRREHVGVLSAIGAGDRPSAIESRRAAPRRVRRDAAGTRLLQTRRSVVHDVRGASRPVGGRNTYLHRCSNRARSPAGTATAAWRSKPARSACNGPVEVIAAGYRSRPARCTARPARGPVATRPTTAAPWIAAYSGQSKSVHHGPLTHCTTPSLFRHEPHTPLDALRSGGPHRLPFAVFPLACRRSSFPEAASLPRAPPSSPPPLFV